MLIDGFVDRLMLTGKPELWQLWWKVLFASVTFENAVSPCVLRNCLNCRGCRGKVLNLTTKGPLYVYHFLRMSTSFYLFWPSKLFLLLLFWTRELGDAKETLLNQEYWGKRTPSFRSSIPRSCFKFRQKNTYPCYLHVLRKTFTWMICRLLIKQLMIMSGLSDSLVRSDIDMRH